MFLDDCVRFDATELLAKSRGAPFTPDDLATDPSAHWTLQWTEDDRPQCRIVRLRTTRTRQRLGGFRHWWLCPTCQRRCRVLVVASPDAPIGCRVCLDARYATDYPARDRLRRFVALFHALGDGALEMSGEQELDWLLARRRRGVRRGRRVLQRAFVALQRFQNRCDTLPDIFTNGGL